MLPLTPANSYRPRVMILGGGNPATATTEIIDLVCGNAGVAIRTVDEPAAYPVERDASAKRKSPRNRGIRERRGCRHREPERGPLRSGRQHLQSGRSQRVSAALSFESLLLLPDATVLLIGGNPQRGSYEAGIEIYSPAYLFNGDGSRRDCGRRSPA